MIKIEKSIVIKAPVEEVFAFVTEPNNVPQYYTGLDHVSDVQRLPNGGYRFKSTEKIAGLHLDMDNETVEFVPNKRFVSQSHSALNDSTIAVTFESLEGDQTRVTCHEEHTLHGGFFGKLGETFLTKYLDHAAEMTQDTLKARIEAKVPATTLR
jgi:uncharacterized membrane protein